MHAIFWGNFHWNTHFCSVISYSYPSENSYPYILGLADFDISAVLCLPNFLGIFIEKHIFASYYTTITHPTNPNSFILVVADS